MPSPKSIRTTAGFLVGRPSISYLYFLLTLTAASLLVARDFFHPRLELLHSREFVQEEMGFFYHKSTGNEAPLNLTEEPKSIGASSGETQSDFVDKYAVRFLDMSDAVLVRGRNFEDDGYTMMCPEGQGPVFPPLLSIFIAFPHAGLEWISKAFQHVADQTDGAREGNIDAQRNHNLLTEHIIILRNRTVAGLLEATQGRPYRAVFVVRDPRDLAALSVLGRPKAESAWASSLLEKLLGRRATTRSSKHEAINAEIDRWKRETNGAQEETAPLLFAVAEFARWVAEGKDSGSLAFVRYEDMWQRNPKGGWLPMGCWLGLHKQHVYQLVESEQHLEAQGLFTPGVGSDGYPPGLWRSHLSPENVRHFKEQLPGVVSWLGYQRDESWEAVAV